MLVTADALHGQGETARLVLERGGDYLFALKKNRPAVHADVATFFADPATTPAEAPETTDADHGRLENRRHAVVHDVGRLFPDEADPDRPAMPALTNFGRVVATVERDGKIATSTRYHLSSARLPASAFAKAVRGHRTIENGLHRVLDTAFREDDARTRRDHGPENLAVIRKRALNVLKTARPEISIRRKRKRSRWSDAFARSVIGQMR